MKNVDCHFASVGKVTRMRLVASLMLKFNLNCDFASVGKVIIIMHS